LNKPKLAHHGDNNTVSHLTEFDQVLFTASSIESAKSNLTHAFWNFFAIISLVCHINTQYFTLPFKLFSSHSKLSHLSLHQAISITFPLNAVNAAFKLCDDVDFESSMNFTQFFSVTNSIL